MNRILLVLLLSVLGISVSWAQSEAAPQTNNNQSNAEKTQDVIVQPQFKGGMKSFYEYIGNNFEYPENAGKRNVSGVIEVEFTVEKSGDITYAGILKGLDYSIDDEILRLIKAMPRWTPATKNGRPVRYKVSMPLNIRASKNKNLKSSIALQDYTDN